MLNKNRLTRVVVYLNPKQARVAEKRRKAAGHKNLNRLVGSYIGEWLK